MADYLMDKVRDKMENVKDATVLKMAEAMGIKW